MIQFCDGNGGYRSGFQVIASPTQAGNRAAEQHEARLPQLWQGPTGVVPIRHHPDGNAVLRPLNLARGCQPHRLLDLRPNALALPPLSSAAASRIRRSSSFSAASVPGEGRDPRISDEWVEKPEPEADPPSAPDPPIDEDEWGIEPGAVASITDEWGEKAEPEVEASSQADTPKDEDEWGREPGGAEYLSGNGTPVPSDDKLEDLKRCLMDSLYGTELGLRASVEDRAGILELINQLEASNPTPAPTEAPELLDGNWILLYTSFSELLPLLAVGVTPLFKIKRISQAVDCKTMEIVNATTLSVPFATLSFGASASFEVRSSSRIQDRSKIDLNPVLEAAANITCSIPGQPPLKGPLPGNRAASCLLTTYLDKDFRISRGDGGFFFVLAKEGSPLLDQLS
ncbi:plastid-lipid-associated protein 3 [Musa troglodytarum]|uniref:Plastid-lipid-associated protein 3 n=1 Tax=Musa troglodytarum TaxID=320322 RepID=A0A9E7F7S9_9LILI|nr:plastid-lipid-associated protein 3 [Musa troglodytarum]